MRETKRVVKLEFQKCAQKLEKSKTLVGFEEKEEGKDDISRK